jgi:hypothetical protein
VGCGGRGVEIVEIWASGYQVRGCAKFPRLATVPKQGFPALAGIAKSLFAEHYLPGSYGARYFILCR